MAILLGTLVLDDATTTAREQYEEVGGREGRTIILNGLVTGETDIDARLDAILAAVSDSDYSCALSLRPGRRLWVRRTGFSKEVIRDRRVGSFELKLETDDPCEESIEQRVDTWDISASGSSSRVQVTGNAPSLPVVRMVAATALINPALSDGARNLVYEGVLAVGDVLVIDSTREQATLNDEDVTPFVTGRFPRLSPGEATLTYADESTGAVGIDATVTFRERWW